MDPEQRWDGGSGSRPRAGMEGGAARAGRKGTGPDSGLHLCPPIMHDVRFASRKRETGVVAVFWRLSATLLLY